MATLEGTVEGVTYRNEDNGYSVLRLVSNSSAVPVTCTGTIPAVEKGESLVLRGDWQNHKRFGRQFSVDSYEIVRPTTVEGIARLLGSGFIPGVGGGRAQKIIDRFGLETLDVLDNEPHRLREVPGIGKKYCAVITEAWQQQKHMRALMLFLQQFGITLNLAYKIYKTYGAEAQARVSANPYDLIENIKGVGFKRADQLARNLGFDHNSYRRIRAGLFHVLQEAADEGHCYLPRNELVDSAAEILDVDREQVVYSLDHGSEVKLFVFDNDTVYLPAYYYAETRVAQLLAARSARRQDPPGRFNNEEFNQWAHRYVQHSGWQADDDQVNACRIALQNAVFLLTGGPGTGKTTTLQVIVAFLREHAVRIDLAAPTGRAAQRMSAVTGLKARTIHRLLEFRPTPQGFRFGRNAEQPLQTDLVVIDETSMIDIRLMRCLLEALPPEAGILFVGDSNQLPSVGAGNVLADMAAYGLIPHVQLSKIFRQAARSTIVRTAHSIIRGEVPSFSNTGNDNCFFITADDVDACRDTVVDLVCSRLPRRFGYRAVTEIQVLSPMHKGPIGTEQLNALLQQRLNDNPRSMTKGAVRFCVGDRVMQVHNNYDKNVFNGDIGFVVDMDDDSLCVNFDENRVHYGRRDLDELVHAYCISIHKSQGCEFRAIVIPIMTQHFIMLQRNLLYTAVTRARELCVFVGTYKALALAVHNNEAFHRYSRLNERIRAAHQNLDESESA